LLKFKEKRSKYWESFWSLERFRTKIHIKETLLKIMLILVLRFMLVLVERA